MKPKLSKSRDHEMCNLFLLLRYFIISKVVNYMKIFFFISVQQVESIRTNFQTAKTEIDKHLDTTSMYFEPKLWIHK